MEFGYRECKIKSIFGLSFQLAKTDFKLKNEGSFFGMLWYLLNPLLIFTLLFFVFNDRMGGEIPNYGLYLLLAVVMFNFFQAVTVESTKIIEQNRYILKSINLPKVSLILGTILKNIFSHFFEVALFFFFSFFYGLPWIGIVYYFVLFFLFSIFCFGACLILSSITAYFTDFENIWAFAVRLLWLATPIFYSVAGQVRLFYFNLFNPLYYFIEIARDIVIYSKAPEDWLIGGAIFYTVLFSAVGLLVFDSLKNKFAELI